MSMVLPDTLDHRTFEWLKVELGRCDVCGTGKAVYRSREAQAGVWEKRCSGGAEFEHRQVRGAMGLRHFNPFARRECGARPCDLVFTN